MSGAVAPESGELLRLLDGLRRWGTVMLAERLARTFGSPLPAVQATELREFGNSLTSASAAARWLLAATSGAGAVSGPAENSQATPSTRFFAPPSPHLGASKNTPGLVDEGNSRETSKANASGQGTMRPGSPLDVMARTMRETEAATFRARAGGEAVAPLDRLADENAQAELDALRIRYGLPVDPPAGREAPADNVIPLVKHRPPAPVMNPDNGPGPAAA